MTLPGRSVLRRAEHRLFATMLLLLHLAIWWQFGSPVSRALMLAHFGLFLLWQPLWSVEQRFAMRQTVILLLVSLGLSFWLDRWLLFGWLVLLNGLIAGLPKFNRYGRFVYMPALGLLVSDLLLGCVPELFGIQGVPAPAAAVFQYGLLAVPVWIFFVPPRPGIEATPQPVDLLRAVTVSLITAMLAVVSMLITTQSGVDYPIALFQSLFGLSLFLFFISWFLSHNSGLVGPAQLWELSLLNIGSSLEHWLSELAALAGQEQSPDRFFEAALRTLLRLPLFEGVAWATGTGSGMIGTKTPHRVDLGANEVQVTLYARRPIRATLLQHCHVLVQLLLHFHTSKLRERQLAQRAHLEAIHETGARVAHDIKNLLQSLRTLALAVNAEDTDRASEVQDPTRLAKGQALLSRQLPIIIRRLQTALEKLQAPETVSPVCADLATWWGEARARHQPLGVLFQAVITASHSVPVDVFDTVLDNLLENAYHKRSLESDLQIEVTLAADAGRLRLSVCDHGKMIEPGIARSLFKETVASRTGFGIGLFQAARQAERAGYALSLAENRAGCVCFELSMRR